MSVICPSCGASAPDGALTCPRCHATLDVTRRISLADATWCPGCGALVAPGEDVCPKCGSALAPKTPVRAKRDLDLPEIGGDGPLESHEGADDEGQTGIMARIESAIPTAGDESSPAARRDRIPRTRVFALAATFAVLVVGGAALLITHPWDPTASQTRATEPADTSMSGYPGAVDKLTGQDKGVGDQSEEESSQTDLFTLIDQGHERLGELADAVDESERALREALASGDASSLSDGLSNARLTSIEVSNLISSLGELGLGDAEYAETLSNLTTLGNWLRNRCDALTAGWQSACDADDLSSVSDEIVSSLDATSDYARHFEENYDAWAPERLS